MMIGNTLNCSEAVKCSHENALPYTGNVNVLLDVLQQCEESHVCDWRDAHVLLIIKCKSGL